MLARERPTLILALMLLAAPVLGGCLGSEEPTTPAVVANESDEPPLRVGPNASGGLGAAETDRTVEGSGGAPHIHDYWEGKQKITLLEADVRWGLSPVFVDRDPVNAGVWQAYFELPPEVLVYEGTGHITITVGEPRPVSFPLEIQYRTALSAEWSDRIALNPNEALEIEVTPRTADSPHSARSLWSFRLLSAGPGKVFVPDTTVGVEIVAYRVRNIEAWPGHPDFYAERPHRVVLDKSLTTTSSGIAESILFLDRGTFERSDLLISMGTTRLEVYANITAFSGPPGTASSGNYVLHYRHPNMTYNAFHHSKSMAERDGNYVRFSNITVDHLMHDPPYAEQSRWQFRVVTFAGAGEGLGGCNGCTPYELTYHLTVVAWNDDWVDPAAEAEEIRSNGDPPS